MNPAQNPFAPGAGTQPPELAGREINLERAKVILSRIKNGRSERSVLLIGLRGVGKTVLLNKIHQLANEEGYFALLIEAPEDSDLADLLTPPLRQILLRLDQIEGRKEKRQKAFAALRAFASVFKVSIGDIGIGIEPHPGIADSGHLAHDITDLFIAIGEAAKESNTAVAILVDELQYVKNDELAALLTGIHRVGQLNLPLVVFGAGLPQLAGLTGKAKSYAERLFEFQSIGALGDIDAQNAIREPLRREGVQIEADALQEIVNTTEGYPYFLQEWGSHTWKHAQQSPIVVKNVFDATGDAVKELDNGFFRVRFDRLTPSEKMYLRAMAELGCGPHRSGDIAEKLGRPVHAVAPLRAQIISKGMIYAPSHGDTAFTVPKFDEYLRRVIPDFAPSTSRKKQ